MLYEVLPTIYTKINFYDRLGSICVATDVAERPVGSDRGQPRRDCDLRESTWPNLRACPVSVWWARARARYPICSDSLGKLWETWASRVMRSVRYPVFDLWVVSKFALDRATRRRRFAAHTGNLRRRRRDCRGTRPLRQRCTVADPPRPIRPRPPGP